MKPRTIRLRTPRHRWFIYIGHPGSYGPRLRVVRLNIRSGGWTLIRGRRPS